MEHIDELRNIEGVNLVVFDVDDWWGCAVFI